MLKIVATSLLDKLKEKQAQERLSDHKFADKLSVSYQLWQMTRTGSREIGLAILRGILRAYPELYRDVLIFLGIDDSILANGVKELSTTLYQRALGRILARFRVWGGGVVLKAKMIWHNSREL